MKSTAVLALALFVAAAAGAQTANPVLKVLQLLTDLEAKIVKEGTAAQTVYDEFSEWCEDRSKELHFEIKTETAEVAELKAAIAKETADIASLGDKVEELAGGVAKARADLASATVVREKEAAAFAAEEKELTEIIDMLGRAVGVLEKELKEGGAAMLQVSQARGVAQALDALVQAAVFSSADASHLKTFLLQGAQGETTDREAQAEAVMGAPDAAVYEGHSAGIVETLEGLLDKAEAQLAGARKAETAAANQFALLEQSLHDEIKYTGQDLAAAKAGIAKSSELKASAEGDLAATSKSLAEDVKELGELHGDCQLKASGFEEETKSRALELKALAEAKKAIAEMTPGAEEVTYGLAQVSFLQLAGAGPGGQAVSLVRDLARKQGSAALTQLASRMDAALRLGAKAGEDPFAKVRGLIEGLIADLVKQGAAAASHKAFCDKEMAEAVAKKEEKTAEVSKLTTKIDKATAGSALLKAAVATLQKELAELAQAQAEMDELRAKEHALYEESRPDLEAGIKGVGMALEILRGYLGEKDKAHEAAEGAQSSIIGLLEVVESDFTQGLAEMIAAEETAQASYEQQTEENEVSRTMKEQSVKYKTKEAAALDAAVAEDTSDRESVQAELDAVFDGLEKLRAMCVAKPESYAERAGRREAEIAGLKGALEILDGAAVLLQSGHKLAFRGSRGSA